MCCVFFCTSHLGTVSTAPNGGVEQGDIQIAGDGVRAFIAVDELISIDEPLSEEKLASISQELALHTDDKMY